MKALNIFPASVFALVLISCRETPEKPDPTPSFSIPEEERKQYAEKGKAAIGDLAAKLGPQLKAAVENGGPVGAVKVCQQVALPLTEATSAGHSGMTIDRTSLKYRNPKNAPDETDRGVLEAWQSLKDGGSVLPDHELIQIDADTVRFYKPIMLQDVCLNCHGPEENLQDDLKTVLDELYPEDKARNFLAGDLRGAFRVEMKTSVLSDQD